MKWLIGQFSKSVAINPHLLFITLWSWAVVNFSETPTESVIGSLVPLEFIILRSTYWMLTVCGSAIDDKYHKHSSPCREISQHLKRV